MPREDPLRPRLRVIHDDVEERVDAVRRQRPDWPCREGCDHCCRSLAELPSLTREEWRLLQEGLDVLDDGARAKIRDRIQALEAGSSRAPQRTLEQRRRYVCPFLDRSRGACRIYAHRPTACRTYGYYVSRGQGRWCGMIEERMAAEEAAKSDGDAPDGSAEPLLLGNHDALDRVLVQEIGESVSLLEWFRDSP